MSIRRDKSVHLQIMEVGRAIVILNEIVAARRKYLNLLQRLGTATPREATGVEALLRALMGLQWQRDGLTAPLASVRHRSSSLES